MSLLELRFQPGPRHLEYQSISRVRSADSAFSDSGYVVQGVRADSDIVNAWKLCNSVFTLAAVLCVYRYFVLRELFQRIEDHLNRGLVMSTTVRLTTILSKPMFWLELIVMAVHLPPYTSFLWLTDNMGAPHMYRGETVMCLINTLRVYPILRVIRCVSRLPNTHPDPRSLSTEDVVVLRLRD